MSSRSPRYVIPFRELTIDDVPRVGGKNASLGEMIRNLAAVGVRVPDGFAVTAEAFRVHLAERRESRTRSTGRSIASTWPTWLRWPRRSARRAPPDRPARRCRSRPSGRSVEAAYTALSTGVAARRRATWPCAPAPPPRTCPTRRFAGQQETYLNVRGDAALRATHAARCMASLFTDRAIVYRAEQRLRSPRVALSVGVQRMVRCDLGQRRRDVHARHRDRLPRRRADRRRLGARRERGAGPRESRRVLGAQADRCAGLPPDPAPRARREGDRARSTARAARTQRARTCRAASERAALRAQRRRRAAARALGAARSRSTTPARAASRRRWTSSGRRTGARGELFIVQARPETVHSQTRHAAQSRSASCDERRARCWSRGKSVGSQHRRGPVRDRAQPRRPARVSRRARCSSPA